MRVGFGRLVVNVGTLLVVVNFGVSRISGMRGVDGRRTGGRVGRRIGRRLVVGASVVGLSTSANKVVISYLFIFFFSPT